MLEAWELGSIQPKRQANLSIRQETVRMNTRQTGLEDDLATEALS